MPNHTLFVKVNPPEEPDGYEFQLQLDGGKRHHPVLGYATWEDGIPRSMAEANARLWAAAPELLDACIAALDEDSGLACVPQLRAAIAKATKEQP